MIVNEANPTQMSVTTVGSRVFRIQLSHPNYFDFTIYFESPIASVDNNYDLDD